ncbi:MAG: hypothetical protein HQL34_05070 [Alphaproteobacteria bacterium]|nr:hypothetical protein [Alphaproteobacteria bacterium]
MAQGPEKAAGEKKAVKGRPGGAPRVSGEAVLLKDRYALYPASPLHELNSPTAQAFAAEDRRDQSNRLFVLICDPELPSRINAMRALRGVKVGGLLPLVEWGPVFWPPDGRVCLAVVYEEPLGGRVVLGPQARQDAIQEHDVVRRVIEPFTAAIKEIADRSLTHRAIRPDNLFYMDAARRQVVFGECVTSPPGYDQPVMCETIPLGMAQRDGRGPSTIGTDLYAMGISTLILLTGRNYVADMSDEEVLRTKINQGSYATFVADQRLPLPLIEVLRGLLSDDPSQRWKIESLDMWLAGRRLSPILVKPTTKAMRGFSLKGTEYTNTCELAQAVANAWEGALTTVQDGQLELWLRRALDDKPRAEMVKSAIASGPTGTTDPGAVADYMLIRVGVILDPLAPIRYRGLNVMLDGIGWALAVRMMQKQSVQTIVDLVVRDIPRLYTEGREEYNPDNAFFLNELKQMRSFLAMKTKGYGLERCLYEMNENLPCQSPLIADQYVLEIGDLLPALDAASKRVEHSRSPVDAHIAAFIATHFGYDLDPQFSALNDSTPERACSGMLSLLAVLQYRGGQEALLGLASWAASQMTPLIKSYHSTERKKQVDRELPRLIQKGSLPEMFAFLDNVEERQKDRDGFSRAKAEFAETEREVVSLERGGKEREKEAERTGQQAAALVSVVIGLLTLGILMFVRLF